MLSCAIALKTRNPNNGAMGHTRLASILRSKDRKRERKLVHEQLLLRCGTGIADAAFELAAHRPIEVTVRRVAPSNGLDPHDGLGAAVKACIDGAADALGLTNDRDARVVWKLEQRRGKPKEYLVEIEMRKVGT